MPSFIGLRWIEPEKSWSDWLSWEPGGGEEEEPVLDAKIPIFDKSWNLNGFEFRHAVCGIVFRRSRSVGNCKEIALEAVGRLCLEGTKIGHNRVDYYSTRSALRLSWEEGRRPLTRSLDISNIKAEQWKHRGAICSNHRYEWLDVVSSEFSIVYAGDKKKSPICTFSPKSTESTYERLFIDRRILSVVRTRERYVTWELRRNVTKIS